VKPELCAEGFRKTKWYEWLIRFTFGGLISLIAGWLGERYGFVIGGLALAFPSILPSTLTLVKNHDGRQEAVLSALGASLASITLTAFAGTVWLGLAWNGNIYAALALAVLVWFGISVLLWWLYCE
jgi:uncharacterized membrane protein (GlpM family)